MDSISTENNIKPQLLTDNDNSLNTYSIINTEISSISNNKIDKFRNLFSKIIINNQTLNLKLKYFNRWKENKKKSNLRSIKILKSENKRIKFEEPMESDKKNKEKKRLLEGKIYINLFERLIKKQNDKLKYFFEKWKNLKYINKSKNYNIKKREIKKIKILPKKKNPEILYPIKDDDIYNNIINILNKKNKSERKKELLSALNEIEELDKNNTLKESNKNDNSELEEKKNDNNLRNKISERTFKRIKNAINKNDDIKQKYFNRWKKLSFFSSKSSKSIKRINRIIFTRKQNDPNLADYDDVKSYKTMDNLKLKNKNEENELNNYILPLYKNCDKIKQNQIKDIILKILKSLEEDKKEIPKPLTPFNDSNFSFSFIDLNTERSEEDSFNNSSMKSLSKRMVKRLRNVFEKKDIKMDYFKKWKEILNLKSKKIIKKKVINKKEKDVILNRLLLTPNIFSRNRKNDIASKIKTAKSDEILNKEITEPNPINGKTQDININNNADSTEFEKGDKDEIINNNKDKENKKDKNLLENIGNSEITKLENSDDFSDKEDENFLEIIKNDIKKKPDEIVSNEEKIDEDKKIKNSCLNGIYGFCNTKHFTNTKNKEESLSIYGNEKFQVNSKNIQPLFLDFLKAINCSIATFNLFTYYSQFHDNKFLIKKKYLPIWRNIK